MKTALKKISNKQSGHAAQGRQSPKGALRRQQILNVAAKLFARSGYESTAIASVAEAAGLSLPGLLHYFPNKEALLIAVIGERDRESLLRFPDAAKHWRDSLDAWRQVTHLNAAELSQTRAYTILNAESLIKNHPAKSYFKNRTAELASALEQGFAAGIKAGEIRPTVNPALLAAEMIAMMDGLQILWIRDPDRFDLVATVDAHVQRIIDTIEIGSTD